MRKIGFFWVLLVLLMWLLLLNYALEINREMLKKTEVRENEEKAACLQKTESQKNGKKNRKKKKENPEQKEERIRVLIMDSDYQTYYHPTITVTWNDETRTYDMQSWEIGKEKIILENGESGIEIPSVVRQEKCVYKGKLEIIKTEKGFLLINELPLETYLKAVLPSEMPPNYEKEALKAQAICARTYAKKQIEDKSLQKEYGADVDDSVRFQVYGNFLPDKRCDQAVEETKGQVICQNGQLIQAYYFSTSSGRTNTDEVWGEKTASGYLKSVECRFDSEEPWSSWEVTIPWASLQEKAQNIDGCRGELLSLQVTKRSQGGTATELQIITEGGTGILSGEYEIRTFLSPKGQRITEKDGSITLGGALLPSAGFEMERKVEDQIRISGGGYGHGVGMSQTAANRMAEKGYSYREILEYFFKNIEITGKK